MEESLNCIMSLMQALLTSAMSKERIATRERVCGDYHLIQLSVN